SRTAATPERDPRFGRPDRRCDGRAKPLGRLLRGAFACARADRLRCRGRTGDAAPPRGYRERVLLSVRDIRAQIDSGRVVLDPYDPAMVQPSSVDVRLDKYFRLFDNHKYVVIDPAQDQPDLTHLVEVEGDDPFVLHPGEFVLASTYEQVTLPDDVAARLEGKSSLGRLGLLTHSTAG